MLTRLCPFSFLLTRGFPLIFCEMCPLPRTHLKRNPFTFSIFLQAKDGSLTRICIRRATASLVLVRTVDAENFGLGRGTRYTKGELN